MIRDNSAKDSDRITQLGEPRCNDYTERLLALVQELEALCPEPFIPLLTDIALARALTMHLVLRYGPERGIKEAREAFDSTLEQMKPVIEALPRHTECS
ncbi:MAG: hypothetical protein ACRD28_00825 [Acidobacteriaceae bacterium]